MPTTQLPLLLRTCGTCSACCTPLGIDSDGLQKAPGVPCRHLGPNRQGCTIYATRPTHCQRYLCAWRNGMGDDEHRPDRLGLLLSGCIVRADLVSELRIPDAAFICHSWVGAAGTTEAHSYLEAIANSYIIIGLEDERARWVIGPQRVLQRVMPWCLAHKVPITSILDLSVDR